MSKSESEFEKSLKSFNLRSFHIILEKYKAFEKESKEANIDLSTFISMLNLHYLYEINQKIDVLSKT